MRIWILGAADPEMLAIEKLLVGAGERVLYAVLKEDRVIPAQAYKSEWMLGDYSGRIDDIYLVECDGEVIRAFARDESATVHVIDHHRPGDPGFGQPPEQFLAAASIGQVYLSMIHLGLINSDGTGFWRCEEVTSGWGVSLPPRNGTREYREVPLSIVLTAACDHCLHHAYAGRCPGVSKEKVLTFRSQQLSERLPDNWVSPQGCEEEIRQLAAMLCDAPRVADWPIADMRHVKTQHITMADAACFVGVAYLVQFDERGRQKVFLGAAGNALVEQFLAGEIVSGLVNTFGDPARGFAGGYIA